MIGVKRQPLIDRNKAKPRRPVTRSLPIARECKHFGLLLDKTACGQEVYSCKLFGTCSHQPETCNGGMQLCDTCTKYERCHVAPNPIRLADGMFNASMIPWKDGYLLAYRNCWSGANISVVTLDKKMQQTMQPRELLLNTQLALGGREDPRLFLYRGVPHVWYIGWMGGHPVTDGKHATVHYARLHPDSLRVEEKYAPNVPWRRSMEKNHSYFDRGGELYAIYSIVPHLVMKVNGNDIVEHWVTKTNTPQGWKYGHMRGGASPVLHRGEFYHFFHTMTEEHGRRLYAICVACFSADPPFKINRITEHPIDVADQCTLKDIDVLFPGGAFFEGGHWVLTMGVHDLWSEVRYYEDSYIERALTEHKA